MKIDQMNEFSYWQNNRFIVQDERRIECLSAALSRIMPVNIYDNNNAVIFQW